MGESETEESPKIRGTNSLSHDMSRNGMHKRIAVNQQLNYFRQYEKNNFIIINSYVSKLY